MSGYYFKDGDEWDCADEYQVLFRPDDTEVTIITEPEDRNFYRDLAPVCVELNALQAENARLREQAEALAEVVRIARNGHYWANNVEQRADSLAYLQSRVKDLADKADAAYRAFREASNDAG